MTAGCCALGQAMYTVPGTIVKFELPSLRRAGHLALQQGEDKVHPGPAS